MNVEPKRLYKSTTDSMLLGVAGGMAEYFGADPTLVRIIWVLAALASAGLALIAYVILAIIVPQQSFDSSLEADSDTGESSETQDGELLRRYKLRGTGRLSMFGIILIAIGALLLLSNLGLLHWWRWDLFWPVLIILAGVALLAGRLLRN